jgi:hypothetical protein
MRAKARELGAEWTPALVSRALWARAQAAVHKIESDASHDAKAAPTKAAAPAKAAAVRGKRAGVSAGAKTAGRKSSPASAEQEGGKRPRTTR